MVENEKYYGILMRRINIDSGIYLFKTVNLIEGNILENSFEPQEFGISDLELSDVPIQKFFVDSIGSSYPFAEDVDAIDDIDNDLFVSFEISESDLKNKYYDMSIEEAKRLYYDYICKYSCIGFLDFANDTIRLISFDFIKLANEVEHGKINFNIPYAPILEEGTDNVLVNDELVSNLDSNEDAFVIPTSKLEEIINSKTYDEMKEKLEEIYQVIDLVNKNFDDIVNKAFITPINGNDIINVSLACYEDIMDLNEIDTIKSKINLLEEFYIKCTVDLDDTKRFGNASDIQDFLYKLVDRINEVLTINDVDAIKAILTELKKQEKNNLISVAKFVQKRLDSECKACMEDALNHEKSIPENNEAIDSKKKSRLTIDIKEMKKFIDDMVIGQEQAKRDVIETVVMNELSKNSNNSCLLVGPTGSGKTFILEVLSKYLNKPMEIIDTTQLTMPGYIGKDIEDFLIRLLDKTNGDIESAQNAIVVFDEIDKKGSENNNDVSGKGVLNTLLPFIQGTTYDIKYKNRIVHFNTSNLTVFATGAFTDVARVKNEKNYASGSIGFNSVKESKSEDIKYERLSIEDLSKYGYLPIELLGRFTCITQLSGHTIDSLKEILTKSKNSPLLIEKEILSDININLSWNEEFLDALANKALSRKTGARSLKASLYECIRDAKWEVLYNRDKYRGIFLTAEAVYNNNCILIDNYGNYINLNDIIKNEKDDKKVLVKR